MDLPAAASDTPHSRKARTSSMSLSETFRHAFSPWVAPFGKPLIRLLQHIQLARLSGTHLGQL